MPPKLTSNTVLLLHTKWKCNWDLRYFRFSQKTRVKVKVGSEKHQSHEHVQNIYLCSQPCWEKHHKAITTCVQTGTTESPIHATCFVFTLRARKKPIATWGKQNDHHTEANTPRKSETSWEAQQIKHKSYWKTQLAFVTFVWLTLSSIRPSLSVISLR